jgi:mannose/fructose-specific phosphotransferase system component IIA
VFQVKVLKTLRTCFIQPEEPIMMTDTSRTCIERPTVTLLQENKRTEVITGNSTQLSTDLVMERRRFSTEPRWQFIMKDKKSNSHKLSS